MKYTARYERYIIVNVSISFKTCCLLLFLVREFNKILPLELHDHIFLNMLGFLQNHLELV